jgi:peptidyl-prolyl cis-trans isomerase C
MRPQRGERLNAGQRGGDAKVTPWRAIALGGAIFVLMTLALRPGFVVLPLKAAEQEPLAPAPEALEVPIPGTTAKKDFSAGSSESSSSLALPSYRSSTLPSGEPPGLAHALGDKGRSEVLRQLMQRNPVVARVNGRDIQWVEVMTSAGDLAIESEDEAKALFPALLERFIDQELLTAAARRDAIHQDREVVRNVRLFEDNLVRQIYVERQIVAAVSPEKLRARYEKLIDLVGAKQQIHARHILVKTRAEAEEQIAALDAGGDFAELAAAHSIGPSAVRGGDLGYFDPSRMVPAFSQAAMALTPGSYTPAPVETPFGWHIIELLDLRLDGLPPFDEMEEALREQAIREAMQHVLRRLRAESEVEIVTELTLAPISGAEPQSEPTGSLLD